jgi:hypothetical protein
VDQVVQDGLHRGVLQEVPAVVHHQQRVQRGRPETRGEVERHVRVAAERPTAQRQLSQLSRPGVGIREHPVGRLVAGSEGQRRRTHRSVRPLLVEGVVEALVVVTASDLDLVLDP